MSAQRTFAANYLAGEIATAVGHTKARLEHKGAQSIEVNGPCAAPRCLVLGGGEPSIGVGPFDRVDNVDEDFDVILALTGDRLQTKDPALELLMARCANPAAP